MDEILVTPKVKSQLIAYLDNIEKQVSDIQRYQAKQNVEYFYEPMRSAILGIHNAAHVIYEMAKFFHLSLANTLKQLIVKSITPLEWELKKRLEMPKEDRKELELKTQWLYAEQSFITRQLLLQKSLITYLGKLQSLLEESGKPSPRCYISYACPSKENEEQEYWVQPFLSILYDHLNAAGVRVVMDIKDNKPGGNIYQFMKQYHEGNYIILVGTESLLQKHYGIAAHAVQTELSIILDRFEQDQKQYGQSRIYPMLISGTIKTAYPEHYQLYSTVRDAREVGYIGTLKKLTDWLYEARISQLKPNYIELWQALFKTCPNLPKETMVIQQEVAVGYHRLQELGVSNKGLSHSFLHYTQAQTVHIAGSFNDWLHAENGQIKDYPEWQMKEISPGNWQLTVPLNSGTHQFKYVINKGERWEKDIHSKEALENSLLSIEAEKTLLETLYNDNQPIAPLYALKSQPKKDSHTNLDKTVEKSQRSTAIAKKIKATVENKVIAIGTHPKAVSEEIETEGASTTMAIDASTSTEVLREIGNMMNLEASRKTQLLFPRI